MATQAEITLSIKVDKNAASQNLSSINKEMKELKEEQRLLNEQVKAGTITQENYEKALAANSLRLKDLSTQAQNANKIVNSQKGSIDELTASLNFNRKAYNALSDEQKANDAIGGKLKNTINQQASSLQDMNASIGKPGLRGGLTSAITGMVTSLGAAAIGFVSVQTAMKVFKGVTETTQLAGDAWAATMGSVNGAVSGLYRTIANGDWSNLFDNMIKSSKAARQLAEDLDDLFETGISRDLRNSEIELEIADNVEKRDIARRKRQWEDVKKYVDKIASLEDEKVANSKRVAEKTKLAYMSDLTGSLDVTEEEITTFLRNYNTDINDSLKKRSDEYLKAESTILNQTITMQTSAGAIQIAVSKDVKDKQLKELSSQFSSAELIYAQFFKKYQLGSDAQIKNFAESMIALNNISLQQKDTKKKNVLIGVSAELKEDEFGNKSEDKRVSEIKKSNEEIIEDNRQLNAKIKVTEEETTKNKFKLEDDKLKKHIIHNELIAEADQKLLDDQKKYNEEYNAYVIESKLELKDLNNQLIEDEFAKAEEDNELWLETANIKAEENKNRLLEDIKGTEDFAARKIEIEKTADDIIIANKKVAAKIQKGIEADKRRYVVDEIMKTTGSIMEFTDALNEKQKTAKKAALLIDSGASIASVVINYIDAASEGFKQMGPIAGIAGGILMTIQSVAAVATIVAKTAQGIAAIDKVDTKGSSGGTKEPMRFALGGWIGGSSHQDGGVNINAEGGEFMVNKRAMMNPQIANFVNAANSWGNGGNGGAPLLTEERVAQIASAVVGAIPVYIVESAITDKQREVQVRESKFIV